MQKVTFFQLQLCLMQRGFSECGIQIGPFAHCSANFDNPFSQHFHTERPILLPQRANMQKGEFSQLHGKGLCLRSCAFGQQRKIIGTACNP